MLLYLHESVHSDAKKVIAFQYVLNDTHKISSV